MTHLASLLYSSQEINNVGLWVFLSIGAVALFVVFIPAVHWIDSQRREREAFYKAETFRRLAEASGEGAKAGLDLLRYEDRLKQVKAREGMKIGGVVTIAVGGALLIFHMVLWGAPGDPLLAGLIPCFIGAALLIYVYFLASPIE
jgi:hypothetical protein